MQDPRDTMPDAAASDSACAPVATSGTAAPLPGASFGCSGLPVPTGRSDLERCVRVTVTAAEDLHIGTGLSGRSVDAVFVRDRRDRPLVPRSHWEGVLRASAIEVGAITPQAARRLFGDRDGARQEALFTSLRCANWGKDRRPVVWRSSARESWDNRAPRDETLRAVEYVPAGTAFEGLVCIPNDDDMLSALTSALRATDRLGKRRTRGSGLVKVAWDKDAISDPPGRDDSGPANGLGSGAPGGSGGACRLRLLLHAVDGVCSTATALPGNLVPSLPFLRGGAVRGAFLAWAKRHAKANIERLAAAVSWGDALPLPEALHGVDLQHLEVLPIPLHLRYPKPGGVTASSVHAPDAACAAGRAGPEQQRSARQVPGLPWWARDARGRGEVNEVAVCTCPLEPVATGGSAGGPKLKRPPADAFLARGGSGAYERYRPEVAVRLHVGVDGQRREDGTTEPALFAVEEIAEDTRLACDLVFEDPAEADRFELTFADVLAGRSWLRAGRGGAPVRVERWARVVTPVSGNDSAQPAGAGDRDDSFTLTLLSDLVARDKWLRCVEYLDASALCELLGLQADLDVSVDGVSEPTDLHGFNAAMGLPRPPRRAIRRGSTWRVGGKDASEVRRALESQAALGKALGEGQDEGLGRFLLDLGRDGFREKAPLPRSRRDGESRETEGREALHRTARAWATKLAKASRAPSLSQVWALREALLAADDTQTAVREIERLQSGGTLGGKAWTEDSGVKEVLNELLSCASNPGTLVPVVAISGGGPASEPALAATEPDTAPVQKPASQADRQEAEGSAPADAEAELDSLLAEVEVLLAGSDELIARAMRAELAPLRDLTDLLARWFRVLCREDRPRGGAVAEGPPEGHDPATTPAGGRKRKKGRRGRKGQVAATTRSPGDADGEGGGEHR